jgi:4-amino-4-deoxy-L-arabinose transferase-like glycosyltransferase
MADRKKTLNNSGTVSTDRRDLLLLFGIALLFRTLFTLLLRPYDNIGLSPDGFSAEISRIAASLASGHGYSGAFYPGYPTAHIEPVYPLLMALVFHFFGICSRFSAIFLTFFNVLLSAATVPLLWRLGQRIYNKKTAWLAAWLLCFWPTAYWRSFNLWSETLATFLFLLVLYLLVIWHDKPAFRTSLWLGLACGSSLLTTGAILPFLGISLLFVLWRQRRSYRSVLFYWCVILLTTGICLTPWVIRNYSTFHKFIPLRSTASLEFTFGNIGSTDGTAKNSYGPHPYFPAEREIYRQQGEIKYAQLKAVQFSQWLARNPLLFLKLTALRIYWFWSGDPLPNYGLLKKMIHIIPTIFLLGWLIVTFTRKKSVAEQLLLLLFIIYPLAYYVTSVTSRYRFPLEPALLLCGAYLLTASGWFGLQNMKKGGNKQ